MQESVSMTDHARHGRTHLFRTEDSDPVEEAIKQNDILTRLDDGRGEIGTGFWKNKGFLTWQALRRHPGYQAAFLETISGLKETVGATVTEAAIFRNHPPQKEEYDTWSARVASASLHCETDQVVGDIISWDREHHFKEKWGVWAPVPPWLAIPHPWILNSLTIRLGRESPVRILGSQFHHKSENTYLVTGIPQELGAARSKDDLRSRASSDFDLNNEEWIVVAINQLADPSALNYAWQINLGHLSSISLSVEELPIRRKGRNLKNLLYSYDLLCTNLAFMQIEAILSRKPTRWPTRNRKAPTTDLAQFFKKRNTIARDFIESMAKNLGVQIPEWTKRDRYRERAK